MRDFILKLWGKVHQPRVIAATYAVLYLVLAWGGVAALIDPPSTIEGALGDVSMTVLSALLVLAGITGTPSALVGAWWLERIAVMSVAFSASLYGFVVVVKQFTSPGNRQLQLAFIITVLLLQLVRWHRIKERPYDPRRVRDV